MADPPGPIKENRAGAIGDENRLKYANDAGFFPGDRPPDDESSVSPGSASDSESECSESPALNLAASLRLFAESMLRIERSEIETTKAREASKLEADRRRAELELQLARMVAQTQLQIAGVAAGRSRKRKRRDEEDTPPPSSRR